MENLEKYKVLSEAWEKIDLKDELMHHYNIIV